jgi:hypothetical protein
MSKKYHDGVVIPPTGYVNDFKSVDGNPFLSLSYMSTFML